MLPLVSASTLADYIIGSSLERVELDALVAKDGKMIAYRALYKNVPHAALTDEYYKKYVAARETVTTLDIEQVYTDSEEARKNVETYGTAETVTTARPLAKVCSYVLIIGQYLLTCMEGQWPSSPPQVYQGICRAFSHCIGETYH